MTSQSNYVKSLVIQNALTIAVIVIGSMLASLLVTLSLLFFVGVELTLYSILISLAVPGIVSPIATIILLHVNHQLELARRSQLEHMAKLASIGELASSIVYEMNQPLAAVELIAEGIRHRSDKDPQEVLKNLPEKIDRIVRQINRATEISAHIQQCIRMKRHNRRHV